MGNHSPLEERKNMCILLLNFIILWQLSPTDQFYLLFGVITSTAIALSMRADFRGPRWHESGTMQKSRNRIMPFSFKNIQLPSTPTTISSSVSTTVTLLDYVHTQESRDATFDHVLVHEKAVCYQLLKPLITLHNGNVRFVMLLRSMDVFDL